MLCFLYKTIPLREQARMSRPAHNLRTTITYVEEELGPWTRCPVPSCKGYLVKVFVKYEDKGRIFQEWECYKCGKVRRKNYYWRKNQ